MILLVYLLLSLFAKFDYTSNDSNESSFQSFVKFCKVIQLKKDDVLVTKDGTIGKIAYIDILPKPATLNSGVFVIRPIDKAYFPLFLYYILSSDYFIKFLNKLKAGSTINHLYQKDFVNFHFPVPPFPEQQKIASILSNVDKLIQKTEQIIEQTQRLKKGLMQRLLTKGIGHTKFKEVVLFPRYKNENIPDNWSVDSLGKLVKIIDYRGRTPPFSEEGIPHLRSNNIRKGKIILDDLTFVSEKTYEEYMTRGIPKENDVLFTTEGPLGEVALVPKNFKFSLAQRIIVLRPKSNVLLPQFLKWILVDRKVRSRYFGLSTGTTLEGIASKWFTKISIPYPTNLEEQTKIFTLLDKFENKISIYEKIKYGYINIKKSLMQQLLTGKIRVKV